jgi:GT2 family glycosyltransferase/cytochrome c-type biogenesis protein CcmH/NrfG
VQGEFWGCDAELETCTKNERRNLDTSTKRINSSAEPGKGGVGFENARKLHVLLTNHHLLDFSGSEVFTFTIADFLKRNGHQVTVLAKYIDENIRKYFERIDTPIVKDITTIGSEGFDVAHIHHNVMGIEVRRHFHKLPIVFLSHGVLPFLEQPPLIEIGIVRYLSVSEEVQENLVRRRIDERHLGLFRNIVDSGKFFPQSPVSAHPARALILSNKIDESTEKTIRASCGLLGIATEFVGARFSSVHQDHLPEVINRADIVFSLGRGVIETMMCGRIPIVLDYQGGDGMVTPETLEHLMARNFSGRTFRKAYTAEELAAEIGKYRPDYGEALRKKALSLFDAGRNIPKLLEYYNDAINQGEADLSRMPQELIEGFITAMSLTRRYTQEELLRSQSCSAENIHKLRMDAKIEATRCKRLVKAASPSVTSEPMSHHMSVTVNTCDILIMISTDTYSIERCISSVVRYSKGHHPIYLLIDASADRRAWALVQSYEKSDPRIQIIESDNRAGMVYSLNLSLNLSSNNVVIVNSDTEVTEGWIERMNRCLGARDDIGVVYPLSNDAALLSVPIMNQANSLPAEMNANRFGELIAGVSNREYPEIPTGIGFCMLISRDTLNRVGAFDPAFGVGKGVENDFCMRARSAGKKIVCCDDVYVHRRAEAHFRDVQGHTETHRKYQQILDLKWPALKQKVGHFCLTNPLRPTQERILNALKRIRSENLASVLHVMHNFDAPGGTELHTRSVMEGLSLKFQSTVLYPAPIPERLVDITSREEGPNLRIVQLRRENIDVHDVFYGQPGDLTNEYVETVFFKFLSSGDYAIVHFQHLAGLDSLLLPIIAKDNGKKVVVSLHDYFLLCPDYNLMFPNLKRCGKARANGEDPECIYCLGTKRRHNGSGKPAALKDYLHERKYLVNRIVELADILIAPSGFVKEVFLQAFGDVIRDKLLIVPHGIHTLPRSPRPKRGSLFRIGFLGHASDRKGIFTLLQAAELLKGKPIQFQIIGSIPESFKRVLSTLGVLQHGEYHRGDLPRILSKTDLVLIPSLCNETFCFTASEALMMRIPVLASNCGAISERIIDGETGFLVTPGDPIQLAEKIIELYENPYMLSCVERNLKHYCVKGMAQNIEDYTGIYNHLIRGEPTAALRIHPSFTFNPASDYDVSIVILTFNEIEYTKRCVESIRRHTHLRHEIVFVDNGSKDGTVKWLKSLVKENPNYKLIENSKNLGFSKGCNQGIMVASGDCIVLLNNDVVVTDEWLSGMMECLNSAPDIGIVGPMTNNISGPQKVPEAGYPSIDELDRYARDFRKQNRYRRIPSRRVVGFCMLFKRRFIEEIGLLDESFGTGNFEDDDLCLKSALAGRRNFIAGDVFIHHYGSRSFIGNQINIRALYSSNRRIFMSKWNRIELKRPYGTRPIVLKATENAAYFKRKGQLDQAISEILDAVRLAPREKALSLILVETLIEAGRFEDATGMLEALEGYEHHKKHVLSGLCAYGLAQFEKAEEFAQMALAIDPSDVQALNLKGILIYRKGDRERAGRHFRKAIEADPTFGESYTNIGAMKWDAGEHDEAVDFFERGFILSPTKADVVTAYHTAILATGNLERAQRVFSEASALFPEDKRIAFIFIALLIQLEKYLLAMLEIERAMAGFGIDDGILSAALNIREKIGPLEIKKEKASEKSLSLCMIVKNEEEHIAKCLLSIRPVAGEIIVVDTGSNDKTKTIAKVLGAKVYDFPWKDDFAEARNHSLSQAKGDWILVLDADEAISSADHAKLLEVLKTDTKRRPAYRMKTRNYTNEAGTNGWVENDGQYPDMEAGRGWFPSMKVRLFPRVPQIQFVNPVHEMVESSLRQAGCATKDFDVPVHHFGKLCKYKVIEKGKRYYRIGLQKIGEMNGDYNAMRELAVQASEIGEYDEAAKIWQEILHSKPIDANAFMNAGYAYLKLKQYETSMEFSTKALALNPESREAALNYAAAELVAADPQKAFDVLDTLIKKNPDYPPALGRMAAVCIVTGRVKDGFSYLDRLEQKGFDGAGALEEQARELFENGKIELALVLLKAAQEKGMNNDNAQHLLMKCQEQMTTQAELPENPKPSLRHLSHVDRAGALHNGV